MVAFEIVWFVLPGFLCSVDRSGGGPCDFRLFRRLLSVQGLWLFDCRSIPPFVLVVVGAMFQEKLQGERQSNPDGDLFRTRQCGRIATSRSAHHQEAFEFLARKLH